MHKALFAWFAMLFAVLLAGAAHASPDGYTRYVIGDLSAPSPAKPQAALMLVGGGDWDYDAFRWFAAKAGHGHIVILRASYANEEGEEFYTKVGGILSAETFVFDDRKAATNPYILGQLARADGVFIAGGDQARYVRFWKGTPIAAALDKLARTGRPIGGTSAGLAILGGHGYGALDGGSVTSAQALADPAGPAVTMFGGFLSLPRMQHIVTDTHFAKRDRLGRLIVFVARVRAEGDAKAVGLGVDQEAALCVDDTGIGRLMSPPGGYAWLVEPQGKQAKIKSGKPLTSEAVRITGLGTDGSIDLATLKIVKPAFSGIATVTDGKLDHVPIPPRNGRASMTRNGQLDELDRQLLALLREDARQQVSQLAEILRVSRATIYGRIARLEQEKIITGYTVRVSAEHQRQMIRAHMMIKVLPKYMRETERALGAFRQLTVLQAVSGEYDIMAEIEADDTEALNDLIGEIGMLDGIERASSSIILATKVQRWESLP